MAGANPDEILSPEAPTGMELARAQDAAALDIQVTTAKQYPRSLAKFEADLRSWACADEWTADQCFFLLPKGGKQILGPSARFAELVNVAYGNIAVDAKLVAVEYERVVVQGTCRDLERNIVIRSEVTRRIVNKNKVRYAPDVIETTIQAAMSIARRNAILQVVPRAMWEKYYIEARNVAGGEGDTFNKKRDDLCKKVLDAGVTAERLEAYLGVRRMDMNTDHVIILKQQVQNVEDGAIDWDKAFPIPREEGDEATPAQEAIADLRREQREEVDTKTGEVVEGEPDPETPFELGSDD